MYDITGLGELLIDFTPNGKNEQDMKLFSQNPGGGIANMLAMASGLGAKTAFIGKVGNDDFGRFLKQIVNNKKVDTKGLVLSDEYKTTLAFVHLDSSGDRSFSFYRTFGADTMLTPDEIDYSLIDNCSIFHFGAVSLTDEPCRSTVHTACDYALSKGKIISYDPNYRPLLWKSQQEAVEQIMRPIPKVNILKVSQEEMELLTEEKDIKSGAKKLLDMGPSLVLVSLGEKGAFYLTANSNGTIPTYDVKTIDTTGAGDSFIGSVLFKLKEKSIDEIKSISKNEIEDIVDFANAAGSLTTTKKGGIPAMPSLSEIENCRKNISKLV